MAIATYPGFSPDGSLGASFGLTSSNVLLPGSSVSTDGLVLVVNIGSWPVFIALGGSSVAATTNASPVLMPGQSLFFGRGTATYLAGIISGGLGGFGLLNITTGN